MFFYFNIYLIFLILYYYILNKWYFRGQRCNFFHSLKGNNGKNGNTLQRAGFPILNFKDIIIKFLPTFKKKYFLFVIRFKNKY